MQGGGAAGWDAGTVSRKRIQRFEIAAYAVTDGGAMICDESPPVRLHGQWCKTEEVEALEARAEDSGLLTTLSEQITLREAEIEKTRSENEALRAQNAILVAEIEQLRTRYKLIHGSLCTAIDTFGKLVQR